MDRFVDGLGFGLMVVGVVIFFVGTAARMEYVRNSLSPDSLPLWARGEGLVLLGGSILALGGIVSFRLWWPYLPVAGMFATAAVIFLRSQFHWW